MAKKDISDAASPYPPVGKAAPAFKLEDQNGDVRTLKDYQGRWVVLYFYPKDDTSGCTKEACQFRDDLPDFTAADAVVLGVSPDGAASHRKFVDKHGLNFTLLADPDRKACEKYGVWQEKSMYGRKYMGVARTTFLIDPQGKIRQVWEKVKVPDHSRKVMQALESLKA